jgi:hypothetical protein
MLERLPAVPPVDRDDNEQQRQAQAHLVFSNSRPRATPEGPNNNPVSIACSAERNSGMEDCDRVVLRWRGIGPSVS